MPMLYIGILAAAQIVGLCAFAYKSVCECAEASDAVQQKERALALLLAERRGQYMSFVSSEGRTTKGFVVSVHQGLGYVLIDTRRSKESQVSSSSLEAVDLKEVCEVQAFDDMLEEVPEWGD